MFRHFTIGRRTALALTLLALLAMSATAFAPATSASGSYFSTAPSIQVSRVDNWTLRVDGNNFTPGVTAFSWVNLWIYNGGMRYYQQLFRADQFATTPRTFTCTPFQCYTGGGTFVYYIRDIPCGRQVSVTIQDGATGIWSPVIYAQACF
jgi:hypothetical protein